MKWGHWVHMDRCSLYSGPGWLMLFWYSYRQTVRWWKYIKLFGGTMQNSIHEAWWTERPTDYSGSLNQYRNNSVLKVRGCVLVCFHCYALQVPGAAYTAPRLDWSIFVELQHVPNSGHRRPKWGPDPSLFGGACVPQFSAILNSTVYRNI